MGQEWYQKGRMPLRLHLILLFQLNVKRGLLLRNIFGKRPMKEVLEIRRLNKEREQKIRLHNNSKLNRGLIW